jgi:hypothetical protein
VTLLFAKYAREVAKALPSEQAYPLRGSEKRPARVYRLGLGADFGFWQIVLKKSFLGDEQNFLGPLMCFASGDVRDHFTQKRTRTIVSALRGFAAVETSKNQLSRNFWPRSVFDL